MEGDGTEFDFTRNDKFFILTIPRYSNYDDVVVYEFHLKDLVTNREYVQFFRFKDLKQTHEGLSILKLELPEFPKTHFWRKTNKNPQMIDERRTKLQYYFQIILNDPSTRGHTETKRFIKKMKSSAHNSHRFSSPPSRSWLTETTKSRSVSKTKQKVDIEDLKKTKYLKSFSKVEGVK